MKTIRIMLSMLLAIVTCSSLAQGIIIYKSNGTQEKLPYIAVDSIIPYYTDKDPVQIVEAKAVDLGLPSGTLWASHNVGATAPELHGGYYALGETEEKMTYSWSSYMCTSQNECGKSKDPLYADGLIKGTWAGSTLINGEWNIAGSKYDVATQKWGESWVMPTAEQFQELCNNCTRARVKINDSECVEYTGPNGNTLIIPLCGGYKENKELKAADDYDLPTYFWVANYKSNAYLYYGGIAHVSKGGEYGSISAIGNYRYRGMQVRPVLKEGAEIPGGNDDPNPQTSDEVKKVTIADFNAAEESNDVWYQLTGTIKNLKDGDQYGNFDLEDETGSVYVYGVLSEKGGEKKKFQELVAAKGINNGDKLTIIGNRGSYTNKNTGETKIEVMNAYFVSVESVGSEDPDPQSGVTTATCAEIIAGDDGTNYRVTGKCVEITNTTYGNWYLEDATGKIYIYGTLDKEGNAGKNNSIASWGIKVGDEITVEGPKTTWNGTVELVNVKVIKIK